MLITLAMTCCGLGFFMLYNTSKKVRFSESDKFGRWLQQHSAMATSLGLLFIAVSFLILIFQLGLGVGILTAFLLLMTSAALIIVIAPLRYLKIQSIIALVLICVLLEILFT